MKVKRINLNEEGMHRFFGSLEAKIMEVLWVNEQLTIKQVHEILKTIEPISLNAVMTVMIRLASKGHLLKVSNGNGKNKITYFSPTQNKEQFLIEQTMVVTDSLIQDFGSLMASHFIDNLEIIDSELISRLEDKLKDLKKRV